MGRKADGDRSGPSEILEPSGFTRKEVPVLKRRFGADTSAGSAATLLTDPSSRSNSICTVCGRKSDDVHQIFDGSRVVVICGECEDSDLDDDQTT